jgi:hypothetical protein
MKVSYFVRRAFESGRMLALLGEELGARQESLSTSLTFKISVLRRVLFGERGVYLPIRILHRAALVLGMLTIRFENCFRRRDKPNR